MNAMIRDSTCRATAGAIGLALAAGIFTACAAWGQERHERGRPEVRERYRTPHLVFDDRYRHGHYYPVPGYQVRALPPGYLSVGFGNRRFFFQGGVWFQPAAGSFVVVRPPIGMVVPVLPPAYSTVWGAGVPYYYANDVYYVEAPGGYAVAAPPPDAAPTAALPVPPPAAPSAQAAQAPSSAGPSAGTWYYCDAAKTYYPYVQECKDGWRPVPSTPPAPQSGK